MAHFERRKSSPYSTSSASRLNGAKGVVASRSYCLLPRGRTLWAPLPEADARPKAMTHSEIRDHLSDGLSTRNPAAPRPVRPFDLPADDVGQVLLAPTVERGFGRVPEVVFDD